MLSKSHGPRKEKWGGPPGHNLGKWWIVSAGVDSCTGSCRHQSASTYHDFGFSSGDGFVQFESPITKWCNMVSTSHVHVQCIIEWHCTMPAVLTEVRMNAEKNNALEITIISIIQYTIQGALQTLLCLHCKVLINRNCFKLAETFSLRY